MKHYLLVAYYDGDKTSLWNELRPLAQDGSDFFLVVPATPPKTGTWTYTDEQAYDFGKQRMDKTLGEMSAAGLQATGAVLNDSVDGAIQEALQNNKYDELIVSTPPEAEARMPFEDLKARIRLFTKIPIRHQVNEQGKEIERA